MEDRPDHVPLLVLGGGVGGYAAAFHAADLGMETLIVDDGDHLGGVCLLRGCIPSKALLEVAELLITTREASERGLDFAEPKIDLDRLRGWKDNVIGSLVEGLDGLAEQRGVRVIRGRGSFIGSDRARLTVDDESFEIGFDHAVIATGSSPMALPDVDFSDRVLDSAGALELRRIPGRLLVVGGGYVGLELGTVYATLGSEVTLIEMTDRLLNGTDADLVEPLAERVKQLFHAVRLGTKVVGIEEEEDSVRVRLEGAEESDEGRFDQVLVAIGRRPLSEDIGLESTGVEMDEGGFLRVDERRRTTDERISAVGDVTGGWQLAHEAMHEGQVAAQAITGDPAAAFDPRAVPAVVYTDPQIAWAGLTEEQAEEQELEVEVTRFPWRASGRALTLGASQGMTKLLSEPGSGRILGVGIVGRGAEGLIGEGVLAIEMGAVLEDLAHSIAAHPTLSETLHEAAQRGLGRPLHLAPRAASRRTR